MNIWTEFKNAILPWLLAAAVVGLSAQGYTLPPLSKPQ
jgi:hypothetical protein